MEALETRDNHIGHTLEAISDMMNKYNQISEKKERSEKIKEIDDRFRIVNIEMGLFNSDRADNNVPQNQRGFYRQKYLEYKKKQKELFEEFEFYKTEDAKADLMSGIAPTNLDEMSATDAMKYGSKLQKENIDMADSALDEMHQALDMGRTAANQMNQQTEQMVRMQENLNEIDSILDSAKRILWDMIKRNLTDKYIWALIVLIIIALIVFLVYKYWNDFSEVPAELNL